MAIRDWQGRNDFLSAPRPGGGSLYGGPPPPPPPAPAPAPLIPQGSSADYWAKRAMIDESLANVSADGSSNDGGGFGDMLKGGLGTVLGGAAKKLDWVANLGLLGAEELSEAVSGVLGGADEFASQLNADGSKNEFGLQSNWDKLNDPDYGFGKLFDPENTLKSDNKWVNRGVGFVGDVAFDPWSYVGGAAMKSNMVMGKLGREGLVKQASRLGMSDDVVAHVGKFGHVGLDDVTREALGVKKAGVYWGWGDASVYLPFTSKIGKVSEKGFSAVRLNTAGRLVGKVGKGRGDEGLAVLRRVAQTGRTIDGISPKAAGITLEMIDKFKGVARSAAEPYARLAQKQFQGFDDATRTRVTKEIESLNIDWDFKTMGRSADPAKLAKLSPEAQSVVALRDLVYSNVREATGGALDMGFRGPGYLPHRSTKEAWDFFGDDSAVRQLLNGGSIEAGQDAAQTRTFLPGATVKVKNRPVTFDDASIADINKKLSEAFPEAGGIKFVEDNAVVLMERYIGEMSRIQGHHAMLTHALDMGELGSVKHMTTEMVRGAQNLTKNKQVADFLKKELVHRAEHESYLLGEAARVGKEISKALDGSLVRLVDEAAEEHKELIGVTKTIKQQLSDHDKGRKGAEKAIRETFTAERARLSKQVDDLIAVKADLDNNIAATKQAIADGYTQETAQVRKLLDTWIKKSNHHAEKIGMDTQAIEGLTELDEMYGFVMSQTGRMEEISSSPQLLMEFFTDLKGTKIVTGQEKLFEEIPLDRWAMDAATENQAKLDILMRDGTFGGWEQALEDLADGSMHPLLNQGRPEITSRLNQSQLDTVDDAIESQHLHIWKQRGDWEDTADRTLWSDVQQNKDLRALNARAVAARDKTTKTLKSNRSNAEVNKGTLANAVKNLRSASDDAAESIYPQAPPEGWNSMAYADHMAFDAANAERVAIAREKLLVQYLEMENRTMYLVAEHMNAPTLADDFGGLSDEVFEAFEYMKEVRGNLDELDVWLASNGPMGSGEWINATALGSDAHRLRQKRWIVADTQEQLNRHTSKDALNDSRTLVDQSVLDDSMEFARQRNMEVRVGDRTATLGGRNQSLLPYDAEAAQISRTPGLGFYGPQRPTPVFPETHAPGNMANARVLDRRVLAQNVAFLESLHKKQGVYRKVQQFVDDDGVTRVKYGTTETEVPVFANPKTVDELDAEIAELTATVRGHQNIIDDLANIPTTSQMDPNNIDREVLKVMRLFLDGVNDSVEGAKNSAKKLQNTRRKHFPQVDTPSHNPNRWQKGKPGRPDNAPDPVKHPKFAGDYDSWSKKTRDQYDYNNDMLRIAHTEGQPWHELATENRSARQVMDDWFELGREPNSTKYMPDAPFGQTWKQTPPWSRKGDIDMNANVLDGGEVRLTDDGITASEHLTSSIGEQLRYSARNTVGGEDARHLPGSSDDELRELLGMGLRSADERYGDDLGDDFLEQIGAGGSRNPGLDLATQERYEREAARSAEKVRDDLYAQLGMDHDMVQQAHGQGVANQRDVLLWTKIDESSDWQAKFATDGEPITPRQLQHRVAEKYGNDFEAYKADHPNTLARDFYTPDGKKSGGIGYKEAGEVLGGKARKFRHGSGTFRKVMGRSQGSYEREMSYLKAQDILERMTPEARTSLYDYAKQIALWERKVNIANRDVAQKQLDELVGFRAEQTDLGERMSRAVGYGQRAQTKFENDLAKLEASSPLPAMTDDLRRLEAAVAPMADDGEFGLNKLAAVEIVLGKREAEQIAELDGVRAAIVADQVTATEHAVWSKDRLEKLRAIKTKKGKKSEGGGKAEKQKWDVPADTSTGDFEYGLSVRRDQFENIIRLSLAEAPDDHAMKMTARLMDNYENQLKGVKDFADQTEQIDGLYQKALAGSKDGGEGFNLDMQRAFLDGYERLNSKMFPGMGDMSIDSVVKKNVENWMSAMRDDLDLKWFDEATQIFKSYATMTPGFHARNFMGATFMNFSDGVNVKDVRSATKHWRGYVNDPENYIKNLGPEDQHVKDAFEAVFAVGAGGSFDPGEIGTGAVKAWKGLKNNKATRMSRRYGEDLVEGPVRLAAALNTTRRGGGMSTAASRVKRLHFDYSDLSSLDQKMKRVIPFYMFMSRNLPLQIEQMWRKPKAYAVYNHFMNNFDQSDEDTIMPKYLRDAGAIVMGSSWFGDDTKDFVLAPDLQHNNLMQDIMAFSGEGDGGWPILDGLLSSANPLATKPIEVFANHSGFRGGPAFYDQERGQYGGYSEKSTQQKYLERLMYVAEGVMPPLGTVQGLTGMDVGGGAYGNQKAQDKQLQKALNALGLPFKQVGDSEREREMRRRQKEDA